MFAVLVSLPTLATIETAGGSPVNVRSFGAVGNGIVDDTAAIQAAIDSTKGPLRIYLPGGTYKIGAGGLTIARNRVTLFGDGPQDTRLEFAPTGDDQVLIHIAGGSGDIRYQCGISGLSFDSPDTSYRKVGIRVTNASETPIENIASSKWAGGTGQGSIGLQLRGREFTWPRNVAINADSPVSIEDDPYDPAIDADHYHFENCNFSDVGRNTNPIVRVASGIYVYDLVFDGDQGWEGGTYGLYWVDTGTTSTALNVVFRNVRWEQTLASNFGFYIDINSGTTLRGLEFDNVSISGGAAGNGIKLRRCQKVTLINTRFGLAAGKTALDIDGTNQNVANINMSNEADHGVEIVTCPTYVRVFGMDSTGAASDIPHLTGNGAAGTMGIFTKRDGNVVWYVQNTSAGSAAKAQIRLQSDTGTGIIQQDSSAAGGRMMMQADAEADLGVNNARKLGVTSKLATMYVPLARTVTAGITASRVQTQGSGALTSDVNEISVCANDNDTVTLPRAVAGMEIVIINDGKSTLRIFPASGDNAGAGLNRPTTLGAGLSVRYTAYDATNWKAI